MFWKTPKVEIGALAVDNKLLSGTLVNEQAHAV